MENTACRKAARIDSELIAKSRTEIERHAAANLLSVTSGREFDTGHSRTTMYHDGEAENDTKGFAGIAKAVSSHRTPKLESAPA